MTISVYIDDRKRDEAIVEKIKITDDGLTLMKTVSQRFDPGLIVFYVLCNGEDPSGNGWRESLWNLKDSTSSVRNEPAYWFEPLS